ncbi:two-pore potassium channel 3-like [Silene latifolia]|uniref:two-pore potassium channel 3-like n=1 Tax=Silene latifolia TaxID=37657 RepID=UPI003D7874CC
MADEPLIRRVETLNLGDDTNTPRPGFLDLRSPRRVSTFNFNNNDKTLALITKDILTPRTVTTVTQEKIAKYVINFHRSSSAPALYTEEKGLIHRDSFAPNRRRLTAPQLILVALLGLLVYIIVGITVFSFANESFNGRKTNKLIDAIYFTIVTLSTIGYGDIVPATTFTKLFTCIFILVGFAFVDTLLNALVTYVLDLQEGVLLGAVDQNQFIKMIETYVFDKKKKRMRIRTKMSLALGVVTLSLVIGTVTLHFMEDMSWVDSFYLSVTSVTTVGYGDYAFETAAGRCFAIVWLLISTLAVARALMYLVEYRIQKRNQRMANLVLQKKLTLGDFVAADLDHDGSISKAEYVVYKLKEMGKIDQKDIIEICQQFETMKNPEHDKITVADLMEGGTESNSAKPGSF